MPAIVRRIAALPAATLAVATLAAWPLRDDASTAGAASSAANLACHKQFEVVPAPSAGALDVLYGVAGLAADDVWAVGYTQSASGVRTAIVERWDGHRWRLAGTAANGSPNPGAPGTFLKAVASAGKRTLWAAGGTERYAAPFTATPLTERRCKGATAG